MNILLLKGFNNYFNRIVKRCSTLDEYKNNSASYLEFAEVNFNPNDGIATELVVGGPTQTEGNQVLFWERNGTPDYLITYEQISDQPTIVSKWFVLESERTRTGQYRIALKRDVLAEHFDDIMFAPCYVEKGYINDTNDPLIFNTEGFLANQIKKEETPIKDETNCAWLTCYIKKNATLASDKNPVTAYTGKDSGDTDIIDAGTLDFVDCINFAGVAAQKHLVNASNITAYFSLSASLGAIYGHAYGVIDSEGNGTFHRFYDYSESPNFKNLGINAAAINDDSWDFWNDYNALLSKNIIKLNSTNDAVYKEFYNGNYNNLINASTIVPKTMQQQAVIKLNYNGKYILYNNKIYRLSIRNATSDELESVKYRQPVTFSNSTWSAMVTSFHDRYNSFTKNTSTDVTGVLEIKAEDAGLIIDAFPVANAGVVEYTVPSAGTGGRNATQDELYDIIVFPYNPKETVQFYDSTGTLRTLDNEASLYIANNLITAFGTGEEGNAIDIQLLPYCPIDFPLTDGKMDLRDLTSTTDYTQIISQVGNVVHSFALYPKRANFTKNIVFNKSWTEETINGNTINSTAEFNQAGSLLRATITDDWLNTFDSTVKSGDIITKSLKVNGIDIVNFGLNITTYATGSKLVRIMFSADISGLSAGTYDYTLSVIFRETKDGPINKKVKNETEFSRLTSPNFNGMFEFKLTKFSDYGIHNINIDCTYKPYSPYIKLNPDFSGLYGQDYNDSTGLILGGDFSLPMITDRWYQYQLENKNYQQIFNRQIQNLDVNQQLAQEQQYFSQAVGIITGTAGGAAGGAVTGAKAGPYGAIIGAAVGGISGAALSTVGAMKDSEWLSRQQAEAKSYSIDMYNYQLGNIKALPHSISKSDPLTYNNKIWPIYERFGCTEKEKDMLASKLYYNGMTIMAVGRLNNYAICTSKDKLDKVYVKGQLIRLDTINDDFHIIDAIYQEVNKGFFVPQKES